MQTKFLCLLIVAGLAIADVNHGAKKPKKEKPPIWEYRMFWDNDVYTGRHFDEIVGAYDGDILRAKRDSILILYEDESFPDLHSFELNSDRLPQSRSLNFVKYNYRSSPRHIFYDLVGRDNLVERYVPGGRTSKTYPYIIFIKAGSQLSEYSQFPVQDYDLYEHPEEFKKWVWGHLKTPIEFDNRLENSVLVKIQGVGPETDDVIVKPGKKVTMNTHVSRLVKIFAKGQRFLFGFEVKRGMENEPFILTKNMIVKKNVTDDAWTEEITRNITDENALVVKFGTFLAHGYLRSFKQAALLPSFTTTGFAKRAIPSEIQTSLLMFLDANKHARVQGCVLPNGYISGGDVDCTSINLPLDIKMQTADMLRPMVEDWASTQLEMSRVYGINEYWDGSVMHGLIGKVTEHVISVEMVIKKDLRGLIDWELEIVDNKGQIHYTFLNAGELMLYESSTTFVKRPKPLIGRNYITVVIHYRPRTGWPWRMSMDDTYLSDGKTEENILQLNTPNSLRKEFRRPEHAEL